MRILIGGDVVPTSVTEKYFISGDVITAFGRSAELCASADRVVINLECALTESDVGIRKMGPNIKASPKSIGGIKALGVTDVMLANNHVFDFGKRGLLDTLKTLDDAGIPHTGTGENDLDSRTPYYVEQDGVRVGFINVCEHEYTYATPNRMGVNPFDPFLTMQDIREAKKSCDYLVCIYHGGKEYCRYPSPRLYNLCHEMVYCGADVVLCQHSHCIGCYEKFEGGHILYGQGNFNFVESSTYSAPECIFTGLLTELEIDNELKIKFHPIAQTNTGCDLACDEVAHKIMAAFEERNKSLLDGSWRDGWHDFCIHPARAYYHKPILGACDTEDMVEIFAHYLDCEAHTDALRELYPTWNSTNEM